MSKSHQKTNCRIFSFTVLTDLQSFFIPGYRNGAMLCTTTKRSLALYDSQLTDKQVNQNKLTINQVTLMFLSHSLKTLMCKINSRIISHFIHTVYAPTINCGKIFYIFKHISSTSFTRQCWELLCLFSPSEKRSTFK